MRTSVVGLAGGCALGFVVAGCGGSGAPGAAAPASAYPVELPSGVVDCSSNTFGLSNLLKQPVVPPLGEPTAATPDAAIRLAEQQLPAILRAEQVTELPPAGTWYPDGGSSGVATYAHVSGSSIDYTLTVAKTTSGGWFIDAGTPGGCTN